MSTDKEQLIYDNTDQESLDASDTVGAIVKSADGTDITHSEVGDKKGLDTNSINEFYLDISQGNLAPYTRFLISGFLPDISNNDGFREIWNVDRPFIYKTANANLQIASTSINDTFGGSGAQTILIEGVDVNYDVVAETVTMNGTTPVNTVNQYIFINKAVIGLATGFTSNAGTIDMIHTGDIISRMDAFIGSSRTSIFYVPNNFEAYINFLEVSVVKKSGGSGIKEGLTYYQARPENQGFISSAPVGMRSDSGKSLIPFTVFPKLAPKTIFRVIAQPLSNSMAFASNVELVLKDLTV